MKKTEGDRATPNSQTARPGTSPAWRPGACAVAGAVAVALNLPAAGAAGNNRVEFELGEVLYENALSSPSDIEGWVVEASVDGPPAITFPHGRMRLEAETPFLFWCPVEFPDDIAVSWDFRPRSDNGLAMFWIAARGRGGQGLFDPALAPRDGTYRQYHRGDINALHVSYFRRNRRREFDEINFQTCNLRKSHGFHLVAESGDPIPSVRDAVRPYRMQVIKSGPHFRLTIDELVVIDWYDPGEAAGTGPVLGDGWIGFRQMAHLIADYGNLQVRRVTRATPAESAAETP